MIHENKYIYKNKVYQFDDNGVMIGEYFSISEACKKTGISANNIGNCLKRLTKKAGGYSWKRNRVIEFEILNGEAYYSRRIYNGVDWKYDVAVWKINSKYPNYVISSLGDVYSIKKEKNLKAECNTINNNSKYTEPKQYKYYYVKLINNRGQRKKVNIHRLVAECFYKNFFDKCDVHHINGKTDDNKYLNLEALTRSEHYEKSRENGSYYNYDLIRSKILGKKVYCYTLDGYYCRSFDSYREAARHFGKKF